MKSTDTRISYHEGEKVSEKEKFLEKAGHFSINQVHRVRDIILLKYIRDITSTASGASTCTEQTKAKCRNIREKMSEVIKVINEEDEKFNEVIPALIETQKFIKEVNTNKIKQFSDFIDKIIAKDNINTYEMNRAYLSSILKTANRHKVANNSPDSTITIWFNIQDAMKGIINTTKSNNDIESAIPEIQAVQNVMRDANATPRMRDFADGLDIVLSSEWRPKSS